MVVSEEDDSRSQYDISPRNSKELREIHGIPVITFNGLDSYESKDISISTATKRFGKLPDNLMTIICGSKISVTGKSYDKRHAAHCANFQGLGAEIDDLGEQGSEIVLSYSGFFTPKQLVAPQIFLKYLLGPTHIDYKTWMSNNVLSMDNANHSVVGFSYDNEVGLLPQVPGVVAGVQAVLEARLDPSHLCAELLISAPFFKNWFGDAYKQGGLSEKNYEKYMTLLSIDRDVEIRTRSVLRDNGIIKFVTGDLKYVFEEKRKAAKLVQVDRRKK